MNGEERNEQAIIMGIDKFTQSVWNLVYCMVEVGYTGADPWWGQEFLRVRNLLEDRGLPMPKEDDTDD